MKSIFLVKNARLSHFEANGRSAFFKIRKKLIKVRRFFFEIKVFEATAAADRSNATPSYMELLEIFNLLQNIDALEN